MRGRCWTWRTRSTRAWSGRAPSRSRSYTGPSPRRLGTSPCHVSLSRRLVTSPCHVALSRRLVTSPCHVALSRALEMTLIHRPFAAASPPAFSFHSFVLFAHTHAPGARSYPHSLHSLPPPACPPLPPRPCAAHGTSPAGRQSAENSFMPTFGSGMLICPITVIELLVPTYLYGASASSLPGLRYGLHTSSRDIVT